MKRLFTQLINIRWIVSLIILCFISLGKAKAQVSVTATIDSLEIMVGEQTKIHLKVEANANQHIDLPIFKDTLVTGIEIVESTNPFTQKIDGSNRVVITQEFLVTSFDSALYYIPPFQVKVGNHIYSSKSLALKVNTIPIPMDSVDVNQFFGPQDIIRIGYGWNDIAPLVYSIVLMLILIGLATYLIYIYKNNNRTVREIKHTKKYSPHQLALKEIEALKVSKLAESGDVKLYYTRLTDVLRQYLKDRFYFNATEMTSAEIIAQLNELEKNNSLEEFRSLLETADLVKFAKYVTQLNENDRNLMNAIEFINETKTEMPEKETEVIVYNGRSPMQQKILLGVIILLILGAVAMLGIIIWILKTLFID